MADEQRIVHFSGDVQGVGFRYTACHVAGRYAVGGYVKNLPDGRVECLLEGSTEEIDAFIAELAGQMSGYIRSQKQQVCPYTGGHGSFTVAF